MNCQKFFYHIFSPTRISASRTHFISFDPAISSEQVYYRIHASTTKFLLREHTRLPYAMLERVLLSALKSNFVNNREDLRLRFLIFFKNMFTNCSFKLINRFTFNMNELQNQTNNFQLNKYLFILPRNRSNPIDVI